MASFGQTLRRWLTAPAATTRIASPWANAGAWIALAPLGLAFALVMLWAPWHSNFDVDSFTRYLQVLAIARRGSAGFANGPVASFRELTPAWTFPAHGLAYGPYPVLGDGVLAIGARLDGFRGIIRTIWLLFAGGCIFTYAITYRLTRKPAIAVAAAYALALASSLPFWCTMVAPFVPGAAFGAASAYCLTASYAEAASRRTVLAHALAGGVLASFAVGSHLVGTAGWVFCPIACAVTSRGWARLSRPGAYLAGSAPGLFVMAGVNQERFGTYNPFSYGPCDVGGCRDVSAESVANNGQNAGHFFHAALPYAPYVVAVALACWVVWRSSRSVVVLSLAAVLGGLLPSTIGGDLFRRLAKTFFAMVFDTGDLDVGYPRWGEDPGVYQGFWFLNATKVSGPWCVRSLLQCSPYVVIALLPFARSVGGRARDDGGCDAERRGAYGVLVATCLGIVAVMLTRVYLGGSNAIGSPLLNYRHAVLAIPACVVLAFVALAELPVVAWHAGVAALVAAVGIHFLARQNGDDDLLRRQVTHWLPLALAFVTWLSATAARTATRARRRRRAAEAAALCVAVCVGYGAAVTWGIDRIASKTIRGTLLQGSVEELRRCTPKRAIVAGAAVMMQGLGLLDERDYEFLDVTMAGPGNSAAGDLIDQDMTDDRPGFIVDDDTTAPWVFDWPGLAFEKIPGCDRVRRIVRVPLPERPPPEPDDAR